MRKVLGLLIAMTALPALAGSYIVEDKDRLNLMDYRTDHSLAVFHDDERKVTCWTVASGNTGGLACLPDWMLKEPKEKSNGME